MLIGCVRLIPGTMPMQQRVMVDCGPRMRHVVGCVAQSGNVWFWQDSHTREDCIYGPFPSKKAAVRSCVWSHMAHMGFPIFKMSRESVVLPEA